MTSFLMEAVYEQLVQHEAVDGNPEWRAMAEAAHQSLWNLYQAIGEAHFVSDDDLKALQVQVAVRAKLAEEKALMSKGGK